MKSINSIGDHMKIRSVATGATLGALTLVSIALSHSAAAAIARRSRAKRDRTFPCLSAFDQYRCARPVAAEPDGFDISQLPSVVDTGAVQTAVRSQPRRGGENESLASGRRLHRGRRENSEPRCRRSGVRSREDVQYADRTRANEIR